MRNPVTFCRQAVRIVLDEEDAAVEGRRGRNAALQRLRNQVGERTNVQAKYLSSYEGLDSLGVVEF